MIPFHRTAGSSCGSANPQAFRSICGTRVTSIAGAAFIALFTGCMSVDELVERNLRIQEMVQAAQLEAAAEDGEASSGGMAGSIARSHSSGTGSFSSSESLEPQYAAAGAPAVTSVPVQAGANGAPPVSPASTAGGEGGSDGTYASADNGYVIQAKFSPGKLTIVEPNKTSVYVQRPGTSIYDFTNPTNGISYSMRVGDDGRSLLAFKPETPSNVTVLNRRGDPPQKPVAGVEKINIEGEIHHGVRGIPDYNITGRYLFEGQGEPIVELSAGGTGQFQTHGMPARPIRWWVQSYPTGAVKMNKGPGGQEHTLILQYLDRNEYDMVNLTIDYQRKQMAILGERFKSF